MTPQHFNGITVSRIGETILIPLPRDAWRPITGGCSCSHCSSDGKAAPAFWDTIAIAPGENHTWTVHAPELHE